ncbi:unnamed protein product, partial [Effrenium voratum]
PPVRWRSGQIPFPPSFSGDVESDPYCLRNYRRNLSRWVAITKEYLPANEQALRALDSFTGAAALELEEVSDEKFNVENGIKLLLKDLEVSFGENEVFCKGGIIREHESLTRLQGESVNAYVRRFRLMERKLQDAQFPAYPDETRAGLRLDEKTAAHLLAGNRYNFQSLLDAIRIQGQGKHKHGGSFRWKSWLTHQDDDDSWYQPETENYPDEELEVWIEQELPPADMEYEYEEEDREGGQQDYDNQADEQAEWADPTAEEAQALT